MDAEKQETLTALIGDNERRYQAYLLKEQALDIFDEQDEENALNRLDKWFENVKEAGLSQFDAVVKTIKSYFYGITNYFTYRLTNAASCEHSTPRSTSSNAERTDSTIWNSSR